MKTVIIGGSSGLGLGAAKRLHGLGHEIVIASRSKEKLGKAATAIGNKVKQHVVDASKEEELASFFAAIGPFDHLVTTAASFIMGPFLELSLTDAKHFFDSKFWGQYMAAKLAAPHIRKGGSITLFSGVAGQKPFLNFSTGSAINAAIEGLTRALALELSPLRVNAISPGIIVSPVWNEVPEKERIEKFAQTASSLPAKRVGQPEDVADAICYLIQCKYATGSIVYVDGGARLA